MVRLMSLVLALMLALGAVACGSDEDEAEDELLSVANAESCEELADAFMPIMQDVLDAVSEMSMEELTSGEEPEVLGEFEGRMEEVEAKSNDLSCEDDEMAALLEERVDDLTASGPVAEMVLEAIRTEGLNMD